MTASGGRAAASVSASSAGRRRLHLVARAAERRLERPQDLRLVVDDEDARPAHADAAGSAARGSASTNAPRRARGSAQSRPPFASAKPRAIESPRPVPPRAGAVRRARTARRRARDRRRRIPGPSSSIAGRPPRPCGDARARPPRREARTRARSRPRCRARARSERRPPRRAAHRPGARRRRGPRRRRPTRAPGRRARRPGQSCAPRDGGARLEPREVEQVRDQPLEPPRLPRGSCRAAARAPCRRVETDGEARLSAATRIAVRGERKSWLTARRIVVLIESLIRSRSASSASCSSLPRSSVIATSVASAGRKRASIS